ncbi:carbonic anhydrase 12-like [Rana temporaria]|uniref:carbonic anhydrase 12-like n=1 Tax=Rana temporaria TaxID=8407 RepID=UPI001AACB29B|nr:carbonic anhydrase 12-like [Rana temporaria]XP_040178945.1 carbonic anhydrase 12-like [Rana temporaria]XP_040178946.1 carbonic anhydrase 12-like [Rana temporaria]
MLILIAIFSLALCCQASEDWCYEDLQCEPATWSAHYPICGQNSQSPINIITSETINYSTLGPLQVDGISGSSLAVLTNNGHTVEASLSSEHYLSRVGLENPYKLATFHIHFGDENSANLGSEHLINGQGFPLEMHFVFYNTKYGDMTTAKENPDGLSVVSVLFELGSKNEALTPLIDALPDVAYKGQSTSIDFNLHKILPYQSHGYYTYQGSLTTPPCSEIVTWHIIAQVQQLNYVQYAAITSSLYSTTVDEILAEKLEDNFRPVQPYNGRTVYRY